jgi:hypothetical protein
MASTRRRLVIGPGIDDDESIEAYYTIYPDELVFPRPDPDVAALSAISIYYAGRGDDEKAQRCIDLIHEQAERRLRA